MQDDGKKAIEDDLIDDDMDFGDFDDDFEDDLDVDLGDDGADLGVDDWDDVDAEESLDVDAASFGDAPPKDSFVKKNFNLIVITAAVLGGGGFVLTQMGGAPAPVPVPVDQATESAELVDLDLGEMPPAPASVDAEALDVALSDLPMDSGVSPVEAIDDSALTPLPTLGDEQPELVPLDFLSEDDSGAAEGVSLELPTELPTELATELPVETLDQDDGDVFEADLELVVDDPLAALPVEVAPESEPLEDLAATLPVFEEDVLSDPVAEDVSATAVAVDENAAIVDTLRADNDAKDAVIADANAQVDTLKDTVNDLKAELEAVRESLAEARMSEKRALANKQAVTAPAASVISEAVVEDVPVKAVVAPPPKKPAEPVVEYKWVLRAAQPGKAMIFNSNTQDVLNVENGDIVPGIGTVESISIQDGLWVVQGKKGRIAQ